MATNVKKLEENVQSQLRSDITAHNITNCIMELVENAIDAQSTSIAVRINLRKFQLQVIDNGTGMTREQLKTVGKRSCTSKWTTKSRSKLFGYRGESLANLRKSCNRLLIVTRTAENKTTFCKEFNSDGSSRIEEAAQERMCKGTTVVAENVMGKTPVRQTRIIPHVELQSIKQYIRATAIMHPLICFSLEDSSKRVEVLRIKRAKTTQKQLKNLYPELHASCTMLQLVSERGDIRIKAIVGDRMCKFKCVRFVYVNKRHVAKSEIEKFFKNSLQKCFRELKMKEALEVRSRWQPVFVLNITCPPNECSVQFELNKRHVEFKSRHLVNHCLVELLNEFRRTLGLEKTSLAHHRTHQSDGDNDEMMAHKKKAFTFIDGELFKKLKDATTLFGIPTTRTQAQRYRHSRYRTKERLNEKRTFLTGREEKVTGRLGKDATIAGAVRSLGWLRPDDAKNEDNFDDGVFRASNESVIGGARERNAAANLTSNENRGEEDHRIKKARVSNAAERQKGQPLQSSASNHEVDVEEDVFCRSRDECNEEREHFLIEDRLFGEAETETNRVPKTPTNEAEYTFDPLPNAIEQFEAFSTPTNEPNLPRTKRTENVLALTKRNKTIVENNVQDGSPIAASVARMLMNCVQQKCDNDTTTEGHENNFVQQWRPTKKILLRDSKLNVRGPFDSEFALKPTDKTFVNYLEQHSTSVDNVREDARVRQPFPENNNCLRTSSDTSRHMDSEMMKLTLRTRSVIPKSPFCLGQGDTASPECYCSCHKMCAGNVCARESHYGENDFYCSEVRSIFSKPQTPPSNQQSFLPAEENLPSSKSVTRDFSFTPYVASPYFFKSASACEEENTVRDIPPTGDRPDETVTNATQNSPVLHVLNDLSLKTLKKKMKYKRNCKMLSTAGAVDVPSGMLEASRPSNRKSAVSGAVGDEFHKIVKPYSVKNHYTLDDDGQSCLRVFPHLRKNDERPTTNLLTIPEELNSFFPFTKTNLHNIEFRAQLDRKFLLTIMRKIDTNEEIIVIFDQHAVDERIRLEQLFETYTDKHGVWKSTSVNPAIHPDVELSDVHILGDFRAQFEEKGLYFKFNRGDARSTQRFLIAVFKVPTCLHSKAMRESSPNDFGSKLTELVESLIKEMVELLREPLSLVRNTLPRTLCETLNYEACRGAIKFGDELSDKVCATLLKKVSECECPFQCAHGRPLLAPLVSLTKIETFMGTRSRARKYSTGRIGRLLDVRKLFEERGLC